MVYKHDSTRITLREFGFEGKPFHIFIGLLGKIFRFRLSSSTDDPPVESLAPFEVPEEALPEAIRAAFEPLRRELEALGFHSPVFHAITHQLTFTQYYSATFAHTSGEVFARLHYRHWNGTTPPRVYLFPVFASAFTDGSWLVSTAGKPDMLAPPQVHELRVVGASPTNLWQAHAAELARLKAAKKPYGIYDIEQLRNGIENFHAVTRDFHLQRGAFAPLTPADQQQIEGFEQAKTQAQATGSQFPEIHAQIEALQRKQGSWSGAIMLLVISLLFFVGLGSARWDWKFALLIVPVLLFHELGHYVAMRAFKYRNLRMFFIPLLGAAVSGSNYNVPGWKKVIVSLMGPLPGIIVAVPLGAIGLYFQQEWMVKLALLTVVLNGFNLLPILPLDGGWIMHTLFFSRHYVLDFAFRLLAVVGLAGIGIASGDKILTFIAIPMAIGLPGSLKLARISTRLRREQLPQASADNQTIPHLTAERIIAEVKAAFPQALTPKLAAQHVLHVFETLNARPPGWFATIFYTGLHLASLAAAFVMLGVLVVGQQGGFPGMFDSQFSGPTLPIECGTVREWPEADSKNVVSSQTIVATFESLALASNAFLDVQSRLTDAGEAARLFGKTLLVAVNDVGGSKTKLLDEFENRATNVFVQSSNYNAFFTISCQALDEPAAESIQQESKQYLDAARLGLIPVWIPKMPVSSNQWEQIQKARRTYEKLQGTYLTIYSNTELRQFDQQIAKARRRGDDAAVEKLRAEELALSEKLQEEEYSRIESEPGTDPEVIRLFREYPPAAEFSTANAVGAEIKRQQIDNQLAAQLGKIEVREGKPLLEQARYAADWGTVSREGAAVTFRMVSFHNLFYGPPALLDWLCARGCEEFKYNFHGVVADPEFEE